MYGWACSTRQAVDDAIPGVPTSRQEAFSDGVLAIAITLLVLEIPVIHARG
jgi:uncharacterized membrane protein